MRVLKVTQQGSIMSKNIKGLFLFTVAGLSGCGTTHLNCDTDENQALMKNAVNNLIGEYLQAGPDEILSSQTASYPTLSIASFNQHIVDVNAKKCDYIVDAQFENSKQRISNVPVSVVFRSTDANDKTHELTSFTISPGNAADLGIAAVKDNKKPAQ